MRKLFLFFVLITFLSLFNKLICAEGNKKSYKILDAASIYKPNTTFVFKAVYDSCSIDKTQYIVMRVLPKIEYKEMVILYDYYDNIPKIVRDSIEQKNDYPFLEKTLLFDNKKCIQIHPPRAERYYLGQYFPFPRIKLPVKVDRKSSWAYGCFNDPITTRKFLWMKYSMKVLPKSQYEYKDEIIEVYETKGKSVSHMGEYTASFLFNEKFGFVKWTIVANNNTSIEFTLIDTYPYLLKGHTQFSVNWEKTDK
jgi:hypothetical protein